MTAGRTRLYMVRHAESPFIFGEERTRGLSDKGAAHAQELAEIFASIPVNLVISSPYTRAVDTVKPTAKSKGLEVALHEELKERRIEGLDYRAEWEVLERAIQTSFEDLDYALEGGESTRQTQQRAIPIIEQILEEYSEKSIVLGTHGNIMVAIMNYYDSQYGYEFWAGTSKPDIYLLEFEGNRLVQVERLWGISWVRQNKAL